MRLLACAVSPIIIFGGSWLSFELGFDRDWNAFQWLGAYLGTFYIGFRVGAWGVGPMPTWSNPCTCPQGFLSMGWNYRCPVHGKGQP